MSPEGIREKKGRVPQTYAVRQFVVRNSSRKRRRIWVLAMYGSLILHTSSFSMIGFVEDNDNYAVLALLLGIVSIPLAFLAYMTLRWTTQEVAEQKEENLDERQQIVRNQAHVHAYKILSVALTMAITLYPIYLLLSERLGALRLPREEMIFPTYFFILWAVFSLPTTIIAWNEPDLED